MSESFVDLTYRGLPLGRRIKLTQVRPTSGYLEMPTPMPVGTAISISTDEGLSIDALVTSIHEQVGGSDRAPGMQIAPALTDDTLTGWWQARVALPEEPAPEPPPPSGGRAAPVTVRPRSRTVPAPVPAPPQVEEPAASDTVSMSAAEITGATEDAAATTVMAAVDPALLDAAHAVVDDGKRTVVMSAVDPAALGLDTSSAPQASEPAQPAPAPKLPSSVKKRRKRR